ncbi:hypothetical protein BN1708_007557 [Verticillium longisporum]|uniref:Glycerophosphocholine acyltransferase 1 n=2 Tax=Verticillium longisporum TaxID=100787 RepID=A0A0G4MUP6_VERLO|nr:hypothetical protein BN1708_007557 [Verticillium longisporum]
MRTSEECPTSSHDDLPAVFDANDAPSLSSSPPDHISLNTPNIGPITPGSPRLSRHPSFSGSSSYHEDWEAFPPLDRLSVLDLLDNFALPQQLEKLQKGISAQTQKVKKSRDAFKSKSHQARERMVEEWRRRVPTADEQLDRYRKRMRVSVDKLGKQWGDAKIITLREKVSFICGVMNIFLSGYLIGGFPEWFHICFDKVTSLFIHIMPCATLHSMVHLWPEQLQASRYPAIWAIKHSPAGSPTAYGNVFSMLAWSSVPYAVWQLSYYFLITVRRREKIAAGRPTSFTWLRRSYSKTWIGKIVLALPNALQEPAFMGIQYSYAVLTMLPCPIWLHSRYASAGFLMAVFAWSVYNGSTYYIDVFGKRFQKELESLKAEVSQWQNSPEIPLNSPLVTPHPDGPVSAELSTAVVEDATPQFKPEVSSPPGAKAAGLSSVDQIPLLKDENLAAVSRSSGVDGGVKDAARARKSG